MSEEPIIKNVNGLQFSIMSPDEIKKHSVVEVTKNDTGDAGNMVYQRFIKFHKFHKDVSKFIIYEINNINSSINAHYVKIAMLFAYQFNIKVIFIKYAFKDIV